MTQSRIHSRPNALRAQSSIELLILLAASFAFLAILLPQISAAKNAAVFSAHAISQQSALETIYFAGAEASSLAPGSFISGTIIFAIDSTLAFEGNAIELSFSSNQSGRILNKNFSKKTDFAAEFSFEGQAGGKKIEFKKGRREFTALAENGFVRYEFSK